MRIRNTGTAWLWGATLATIVALAVCPPALARDRDEAERLYRQAQQQLNSEKFRDAAKMFEKAFEADEKSIYAGEALYWHAFALYRLGGKAELRNAARALELARDAYEKARTRDDVEALQYRIYDKLAQMGERSAARWLAERAEFEAQEEATRDQETKLAALHALMNMNPEKTIPILKKILQNREPGTGELREQAIFLLSQHGPQDCADLLVDLARNDPDVDVRRQAVFWLSQIASEQALVFLEEIATGSDDPELVEQALFALSQHGDERARRVLKQVVLKQDADAEIRARAIHWLSQSGDEAEIDFLMELYGSVDSMEMKEQILFAVAQQGDERASGWLLEIIFDEQEPMEARQNALFWAGQQGQINLDELARLYDTIENPEMREQVIFVLSQRSDADSFDILLDIARQETDSKLRQQLIFWIGQSGDPRAEDFLLEILEE